jgi:hypothetical protein
MFLPWLVSVEEPLNNHFTTLPGALPPKPEVAGASIYLLPFPGWREYFKGNPSTSQFTHKHFRAK